ATERRAMLKDIAEKYRFNTVRIFTSWAYHHPSKDRFEFGEVEEVLQYCDELGLRVLMGVMLEDAPFWLEAEHPETRYVNAEDRPSHLGTAPNDATAGAPGLCLDWAPVREAAARYLRQMAKVVSAHPSLYAYDCWNEPHFTPVDHRLVGNPINI